MQHPKQMTDRSFGIALSVFLCVLTLIGWILSDTVSITLIVAAGCVFGLALVVPGLLLPLNRIWTWLGLKIGSMINILILGIFYYLVILPTGILMRLTSFDPMGEKRRADSASYWTPVDRKANPETYPDTF